MIAVVVGHHPGSRGATAVSGVREFDVNVVLARQLAARCPDVRLFYNREGGSSADDLARAVAELNAAGPDYVVELHYNAVPERNDDGLRMAYWHAAFGIYWHTSQVGRDLATDLGTACCNALGTQDRGPVARTSGYPMLRDTSAPSVLLETHNGSNPTDHAEFIRQLASGCLADEIAAVLTRWAHRAAA